MMTSSTPVTEAETPRQGKASRIAEGEAGLDPALRRCLVTGNTLPRQDLLRFVAGPDGAIVPDVDGKLPGRGIWLMPQASVVRDAIKRRAFARGAKEAVSVPDHLVELCERLIAARALAGLGLARRAGAVTTGFEKVRAALESGAVAMLVEAADGGRDGREKLKRIKGEVPVIDIFSSQELSLALGRENVIHAALAPGRLTERLAAEAKRLQGFRQRSEMNERSRA